MNKRQRIEKLEGMVGVPAMSHWAESEGNDSTGIFKEIDELRRSIGERGSIYELKDLTLPIINTYSYEATGVYVAIEALERKLELFTDAMGLVYEKESTKHPCFVKKKKNTKK